MSNCRNGKRKKRRSGRSTGNFGTDSILRERFCVPQTLTITTSTFQRLTIDNVGLGTRYLDFQDTFKYWRVKKLIVHIPGFSPVNSLVHVFGWSSSIAVGTPTIGFMEFDHQIIIGGGETVGHTLVIPESAGFGNHKWLLTEATGDASEDVAGSLVWTISTSSTVSHTIMLEAFVEFKSPADPSLTMERRARRLANSSVPKSLGRFHPDGCLCDSCNK